MSGGFTGWRRSIPVLYVGGFLGPFAAGLSGAILPEIGETFGVGSSGATVAIAAYIVPFAGLMLVSSALGRRWGATRTVAIAYALLVVASLGSAMAPVWWVFLVFQAACGALNAFTTPLLMAALSQVTRADRIGRALGTFSAFQSVGLLCAPLLSGILATVSWRIAYVVVAAFALGILLAGLPRMDRERTPWRRLFAYFSVRWVYSVSVVVLLIGICVNGLAPVVVLYATHEWGLTSVERGLLVMSGGVAAAVISSPVGALTDRHGPRRVVRWGLLAGIAGLVPAPFMPSPWTFAVWWFVACAASQMTIVALLTALIRRPDGASAISVFQAARFAGLSLAPALFVPLYAHSIAVAFLTGAAGLLVAMALLPFIVARRQPQ